MYTIICSRKFDKFIDLDAFPWKTKCVYAIKNGQVLKSNCTVSLWEGAKAELILNLLKPITKNNPHKIYILIRSDHADKYKDLIEDLPYIFITCSSKFKKDNLIILPSPYGIDYTKKSNNEILEQNKIYDWENKINKVVWRGDASGLQHNYRTDIVKKLEKYKYADIGFTRFGWGSQSAKKDFNPVPKLTPLEQTKYKIILVIDGWGHPNSFVWSIYSKSLVIVVSDYHCGYMSILQDKIHYLRSTVDNILDTIDWVWNNDNKARKIANNLFKFAQTEFTSRKFKKRLNKVFTIPHLHHNSHINLNSPLVKKCGKSIAELFKFWSKYAEKIKIDYTLLAGSLLTQVRDKKILPWDDDIDIGIIKMKDWYKFTNNILKKNHPIHSHIIRGKTYKTTEFYPGIVAMVNTDSVQIFLIKDLISKNNYQDPPHIDVINKNMKDVFFAESVKLLSESNIETETCMIDNIKLKCIKNPTLYLEKNYGKLWRIRPYCLTKNNKWISQEKNSKEDVGNFSCSI